MTQAGHATDPHGTSRVSPPKTDADLVLAIDTATSQGILALGDRAGRVLAEDAWVVGHRHSEELLPHLSVLLERAGGRLDAIGAIVVGTGPGAFTGLRVGLATAKALAVSLGCSFVGVSTAEALLAADRASGGASGAALLLPAGPSDRVLVVGGSARLLAAPGPSTGGAPPAVPDGDTAGVPANVVAVDLDGRATEDALSRGRAALAGLGVALLQRGVARLVAGEADDIAFLVPEYVTLPRGVREERGEVQWSRARP